eukprot:10438957-Prorocentrum_lima.AAC.1
MGAYSLVYSLGEGCIKELLPFGCLVHHRANEPNPEPDGMLQPKALLGVYLSTTGEYVVLPAG